MAIGHHPYWEISAFQTNRWSRGFPGYVNNHTFIDRKMVVFPSSPFDEDQIWFKDIVGQGPECRILMVANVEDSRSQLVFSSAFSCNRLNHIPEPEVTTVDSYFQHGIKSRLRLAPRAIHLDLSRFFVGSKIWQHLIRGMLTTVSLCFGSPYIHSFRFFITRRFLGRWDVN